MIPFLDQHTLPRTSWTIEDLPFFLLLLLPYKPQPRTTKSRNTHREKILSDRITSETLIGKFRLLFDRPIYRHEFSLRQAKNPRRSIAQSSSFFSHYIYVYIFSLMRNLFFWVSDFVEISFNYCDVLIDWELLGSFEFSVLLLIEFVRNWLAIRELSWIA